MNYKNIFAAIIFTTVPLSGFAEHNRYKNEHISKQVFYDFARVSSVTPITKTVERRTPQKICKQERVIYRSANSHTPAILGGIIGAALGNQLGHQKSNKRVGAVAGSILGAAIGHDIGNGTNRGYSDHRTKTLCHDEYNIRLEEQIIGYRVQYRYKGNTYYTQTQNHPGKKIKLQLRFDTTDQYAFNHRR